MSRLSGKDEERSDEYPDDHDPYTYQDQLQIPYTGDDQEDYNDYSRSQTQFCDYDNTTQPSSSTYHADYPQYAQTAFYPGQAYSNNDEYSMVAEAGSPSYHDADDEPDQPPPRTHSLKASREPGIDEFVREQQDSRIGRHGLTDLKTSEKEKKRRIKKKVKQFDEDFQRKKPKKDDRPRRGGGGSGFVKARDGKVGEGGGQLVRIAVGLAALTTKPIKITNIRANRPRPGLKTQHFTAIQWLADATDAQVDGLRVGSKTLTFIPSRPPTELAQRNIKISPRSTSAASALLVLQAIMPFLLFASDDDDNRIEVTIHGGTHTSNAPSFEYLIHVLLPTLEARFGIKFTSTLSRKGWSIGRPTMGCIQLWISPVPRNESLLFRPGSRQETPLSNTICKVEVIMLIPEDFASQVEREIRKNLRSIYPDAEIIIELQRSQPQRWYVLLVAHSMDGRRWGKDILCSPPKKDAAIKSFISKSFGTLCDGLEDEVSLGGEVDAHLQDQLVCFQALCSGTSSFIRHDAAQKKSSTTNSLTSDMKSLNLIDEDLVEDDAQTPFGHGSLHTQTARWVVKRILPEVKFFNGGDVVQGVGTEFASST
ncbi:RNA 3 -terminal phosphate cyclase [Paramyrothecium foliicola]|nr:RNA 3 -terminal phosphate cyclase [Paramyrothecium foliicola]